jgi:hypothetical protein
MFTTAKHSNIYNTFTYETRMSRSDASGLSYGIYFNGTPSPLSATGGWNSGYVFYVADDGHFSLWSRSGGVASPIVNWTSYSGITSGWNTLKVTYNSSTHYIQLYINGTRLVWGTLTSFTSGQVGVAYYRDSSASQLYVDSATLSLSAPSAILAGESSVSGEGIHIDETKINLGVMGGSEMRAP